MSRADDLLAGIRQHAQAAVALGASYAVQAGGEAARGLARFVELDAHLSADGRPPAAWVPDLATMHEEVSVVFHPSTTVPGATNLELDGPAGHRFRVHVNDGLVLDVTVPANDDTTATICCANCGPHNAWGELDTTTTTEETHP